jgi:hypothetical protein
MKTKPKTKKKLPENPALSSQRARKEAAHEEIKHLDSCFIPDKHLRSHARAKSKVWSQDFHHC